MGGSNMKNGFKKGIIAIICVFAILFGLCSQGVFAASSKRNSLKSVSVDFNSLIAPTGNVSAYEDFGADILKDLKECKSPIDVSSYNYTLEQMKEALAYIQFDIPEAFNASFSITYTLANKAISLDVTYKLSKSDYDKVLSAIKTIAEGMISDIKGSNLTDAEKVLLVHDRLATWCEYDTSASSNDEGSEYRYSMVGLFLNKKAVCMGYADAFNYIMSMLGIESYCCNSTALNHTWNIVIVDGEKYHCDVTFDDPTDDTYGRVYHDFVLASTAAITANLHNATDYDSTPTDTTYDNYFWRDLMSSVQYLNGKVYYADSVQMKIFSYTPPYSASVTPNEEKDLRNTNWGYYSKLRNGNKANCWSSLISNGTNLFYTTQNSIYTLSGDKVYTDTEDSETDILLLGAKYYNGSFYIDRGVIVSGKTVQTREIYSVIFDYGTKGNDITLESLGIKYDSTEESTTESTTIVTTTTATTTKKDDSSTSSTGTTGTTTTPTSKPEITTSATTKKDDSSTSSTGTTGTTTTPTPKPEITTTTTTTTKPTVNAKIEIRNYKNSVSVSYRTTCTFTYTGSLPSGTTVQWYVNGQNRGTGNSVTVSQAKSDFTVKCVAVNNGKIIAESQTQTVHVDIGFFAKLVAWFKSLFGSLPTYNQ